MAREPSPLVRPLTADFTIVGPRSWGICAGPRLTSLMLDMLLRKQVAAILIHDVIEVGRRRRLISGLERRGLTWWPRVGVGPLQRDFRDDPEAYFARVASARSARIGIGHRAGDPLAEIFAALSDAWSPGVEFAHEPGRGDYFAGAYESVAEMVLDADFAPRHSPGWRVGRMRRQIAASICVDTGSGHNTDIYRCAWTPNAEQHIQAGVEPCRLTTGVAFLRIPCIEGALLLLDAANFRQITTNRGSLGTTFTCSLGIPHHDSPLEAWS